MIKIQVVLKELFSESGSVSMMRLMAFMALTTAIILALASKQGYEAFLLAAMGGKVAQKVAEK